MKAAHKVWLGLGALVVVCIAIARKPREDPPVSYDELMRKIGKAPSDTTIPRAAEERMPAAHGSSVRPIPPPAEPVAAGPARQAIVDRLTELAYEGLMWEITVLRQDSAEACPINLKDARTAALNLREHLAAAEFQQAATTLTTCLNCTSKSWSACWDLVTISRQLGATATEFEYDPSAALPKKTGRARIAERAAVSKALKKLIADAGRRCALHPGEVDTSLDDLADKIRRRAEALNPLDENLLASADAASGCTECGLQMEEYCRRATWALERAQDEPDGRVVGRE